MKLIYLTLVNCWRNFHPSESSKELNQADPTIKEGILDAELYKWYESAAIPVYIEAHKKIEKHKFK